MSENVRLELWFPTVIGYVDNPFHKEIEKSLIKRSLEIRAEYPSAEGWIAKTYNTNSGVYNIQQDDVFKRLSDWISKQVNIFADNSKMRPTFVSTGGWLNIYQKGDFQEYHIHEDANLSTIYFVSNDEGASRVIFRSPKNPMNSIKYYEDDPKSFQETKYESIPGRLLIFNSDILHCVEAHPLDSLRFSLSYDFIQDIRGNGQY